MVAVAVAWAWAVALAKIHQEQCPLLLYGTEYPRWPDCRNQNFGPFLSFRDHSQTRESTLGFCDKI